MIVNQSPINLANDTLSKRRQISATQLDKRQKEVYSVIPEFENIGFEITSLGASYTMANLAKQPEQAQKLKAQMTALQQKREQLLRDNNFDIDYLDPVYFCKRCKDKGYSDGKICSCMKKEILYQQQTLLSGLSPAPDTSFETFLIDYYSEIPNENGVSPRMQMAQILEYCKDFAANFSQSKKSILMRGSSGLGKTHLSCAIAKECINQGFTVMYASSQTLFSQVESTKYDKNGTSLLSDILECDLFILDDLGTEFMTQYSLSVLYNIINTRLIKLRPCIYSTNLTSQPALTAKYGEKIASRLLGSCDPLSFKGKDIRLIKC